MLYPVFQSLALAGGTGLARRFQHPGAIVGMNLFNRRSGLQFLRRVSEHVLISWTVVDSLASAIHDSDHVGGIFGDELKELVPVRQLSPDSLQLQVLIKGVDVEQQYDACKSPNPFPEVGPVTTLGLRVQLEEGQGDNSKSQNQGYEYSQPP